VIAPTHIHWANKDETEHKALQWQALISLESRLATYSLNIACSVSLDINLAQTRVPLGLPDSQLRLLDRQQVKVVQKSNKRNWFNSPTLRR